jgi:hypothetical protein
MLPRSIEHEYSVAGLAVAWGKMRTSMKERSVTFLQGAVARHLAH